MILISESVAINFKIALVIDPIRCISLTLPQIHKVHAAHHSSSWFEQPGHGCGGDEDRRAREPRKWRETFWCGCCSLFWCLLFISSVFAGHPAGLLGCRVLCACLFSSTTAATTTTGTTPTPATAATNYYCPFCRCLFFNCVVMFFVSSSLKISSIIETEGPY